MPLVERSVRPLCAPPPFQSSTAEFNAATSKLTDTCDADGAGAGWQLPLATLLGCMFDAIWAALMLHNGLQLLVIVYLVLEAAMQRCRAAGRQYRLRHEPRVNHVFSFIGLG